MCLVQKINTYSQKARYFTQKDLIPVRKTITSLKAPSLLTSCSQYS